MIMQSVCSRLSGHDQCVAAVLYPWGIDIACEQKKYYPVIFIWLSDVFFLAQGFLILHNIMVDNSASLCVTELT